MTEEPPNAPNPDNGCAYAFVEVSALAVLSILMSAFVSMAIKSLFGREPNGLGSILLMLICFLGLWGFHVRVARIFKL
jgi:hypothetical protein